MTNGQLLDFLASNDQSLPAPARRDCDVLACRQAVTPPFGLVTGGSSGIGLALAEALQARGCRVVVAGRDAGRLAAAEARLAPLGPVPPETLTLDVRDAAAVRATMEGLLTKYGAPSWVVTSAGIAWPGRFLDQPLSEHEAQWRTNYLGTLHVLHALAPAMARAGRGQVILISSAAALAGFAGYGAYAPSKWALRGLGDILSIELGAHGIRVLTAFPPDTDTPQLAEERARRPAFTARFAAANKALSAAYVASSILHAADRGRRHVAPGFGASLLLLVGLPLARYIEALQRRLLRRHPEEFRPP